MRDFYTIKLPAEGSGGGFASGGGGFVAPLVVAVLLMGFLYLPL